MPVTRRALIATATLAAACPAAAQPQGQGKTMTSMTGLQFTDTIVGTGPNPIYPGVDDLESARVSGYPSV